MHPLNCSDILLKIDLKGSWLVASYGPSRSKRWEHFSGECGCWGQAASQIVRRDYWKGLVDEPNHVKPTVNGLRGEVWPRVLFQSSALVQQRAILLQRCNNIFKLWVLHCKVDWNIRQHFVGMKQTDLQQPLRQSHTVIPNKGEQPAVLSMFQ